MREIQQMKLSIRRLIIFFMIALVLSGITAFGIQSELAWVLSVLPVNDGWGYAWLDKVYHAVKEVNHLYPFIAYGYDWLGFAHLVIAVTFIGPLRDPVKNIWIIQFGCIACIMVFPLAFIAGSIRHIPLPWTLIDCSFGFFGLIPLLACYRKIMILEKAINFRAALNNKTR